MYKCIGVRSYEFTRDGKKVRGTTFYFTYPLSSPSLGEGTERVSVSSNYCGYFPSVGDVVSINYNKYGRVQGFCLIEDYV